MFRQQQYQLERGGGVPGAAAVAVGGGGGVPGAAAVTVGGGGGPREWRRPWVGRPGSIFQLMLQEFWPPLAQPCHCAAWPRLAKVLASSGPALPLCCLAWPKADQDTSLLWPSLAIALLQSLAWLRLAKVLGYWFIFGVLVCVGGTGEGSREWLVTGGS